MRAASAAGGKQDVPTLEEQSLYANLCILGIAGPNLRSEGIELGRTTFRRSNNKALEYVLYRLYSIIEGKSRAQKDFKGMLPVLDKVQQAPFYQRIGEWMMELKKSGRLEPSVILPVSALKTNTSNRLVLLLLELSTIALQHDLEASAPGTVQALFLPTTSGGGNGFCGLPEDSFLPAEVRVGLGATRAKQACSDFLSMSASESYAFDSMGQLVQTLKRRYYEIHAEKGRQDAAMAELSNDAAGHTGADSPLSGTSSPVSSNASVRVSSGAMLGGKAPQSSPSVATTASEHSSQHQPSQPRRMAVHGRSHHHDGQAAVALFSGLLSSLDEHLRVHVELSKALMTGDAESSSSGGKSDSTGRGAAGEDAMLNFAKPLQSQQHVLHPHQIDGAALAEASAAAAAAALEPAARAGVCDNGQRRHPKHLLTPFAPENLVGAVLSFSSLLSSLAPHIMQLAMAGENAGPPPLLQPPSQPSSHAAHMVHQLQVHDTACKQIAQLSRKFHERAVAFDSVLGELRAANGRAQAARGDVAGFGAPGDDYLGLGALPPLALPAPGASQVQAEGSSRLDSPGPGSASHASMLAAASPGAWRVGASGADGVGLAAAEVSPTASTRAPSAFAAAPKNTGAADALAGAEAVAAATAVHAEAGKGGLDMAKLQERMRSLCMHADAAAPAHSAASAAGAASTVPISTAAPPQTHAYSGLQPAAGAGSSALHAAPATNQMSHEALMARLRSAMGASATPPAVRSDKRPSSHDGEHASHHQQPPVGQAAQPGAELPGSTAAWPPDAWQGRPGSAKSVTSTNRFPAAPLSTTAVAASQQQPLAAPQQEPQPPGWLLQHMLEPQPASPSSRRALDVQFSRQHASTGGSAAPPWLGGAAQPLSPSRADFSVGASAGAAVSNGAHMGPHSAAAPSFMSGTGLGMGSSQLGGRHALDADTPNSSGSRARSSLAAAGSLSDAAAAMEVVHGSDPLAAITQSVPGAFPAAGSDAPIQTGMGFVDGAGHGNEPSDDADGDADFGLLAAEGALVSQALINGSSTAASSAPLAAEPLAAVASTANAFEGGDAWRSSFGGGVKPHGVTHVEAGSALAAAAGTDLPFGLESNESAVAGQGFADGFGGDGMDVDMPDSWASKTTGAGAFGFGTAGEIIDSALVADYGAVVVPQPQSHSRVLHEASGAATAGTATAAAGATASSGSFGADLLALKARMQAITGQSASGN